MTMVTTDDSWTPRPEAQLQAICDLGFSLFSAIAGSVLRAYDHEKLGVFLVEMFRSHHGQFFLDGLKKLGLDAETSDAVRSAKYHYFSNVIGGIDMGYAEESPRKAWVFYNTPFCYFDSPFSPSVGAAFMRPEGYAQVFRAWHGNNGRSLGNPRLAFVFTHMVFRGDPYDAGYFREFDHDLEPEGTYQENWGETPPPMTTLALDGGSWTAERRLKAACNYHAGYIADSLHHLVGQFGAAAAAEMVEHAYRIFLFQGRTRLATYLDVELGDELAAALLLKRFQQLFREEVRLEAAEGGVTVRQEGSYLRKFSAEPLPLEIEAAITAAWDAFTRFVTPGCSVRQTASLAGGDGRLEWVFAPK